MNQNEYELIDIIKKIKKYKLTKTHNAGYTVTCNKQVFEIKDFSKLKNLHLVPHYEKVKERLNELFLSLDAISEGNDDNKKTEQAKIFIAIVNSIVEIYSNVFLSFKRNEMIALLDQLIEKSDTIINALIDILLCVDVAVFRGLQELHINQEAELDEFFDKNPESLKELYSLLLNQFTNVDADNTNKDDYDLNKMKPIGNA